MTLTMADAIYPSNLPAGFDAYAGYNDGRWPDFQQIATQHGAAHLLSITVYLANAGDCLDVENGDATPDQAPAFYKERVAAGVWRPVLYGSIASSIPAIVAAMSQVGIPRSAYRLWSAHYGAGQHICTPTTCSYAQRSHITCDGTQWSDQGNGGAYDESLLADDFFAAAPTPAPSPPTPTPVEAWKEHPMMYRNPTGQVVMIDGAYRFYIDNPADYQAIATTGVPCASVSQEQWQLIYGLPSVPVANAG